MYRGKGPDASIEAIISLDLFTILLFTSSFDFTSLRLADTSFPHYSRKFGVPYGTLNSGKDPVGKPNHVVKLP